jgi:hypothetical protein
VSDSHDEQSAHQPPSGGSPLGGDPQKLRDALIAFLNGDQADWDALSRDLSALASSDAAASRLDPRLQTPGGFVDSEEARDAWRQLADYLAHADRAQGVPLEVRQLLESDTAARAAAAAFAQDLSSQRDAWLDFARQIERSRSQKRRDKN